MRMRKIKLALLVIVVGIMLFSLFRLCTGLYSYYKGQETYEMLGTAVTVEKHSDDENDGKMNSISVDFSALKKENPDVKAWLYSEKTPINYPVVQGEDNSRYLTQMYNLEWNGCGAIFIDYRCEKPFEDFNTIIYGHRMKDNSMFGSFGEYREQKYFDSHDTMLLATPDRSYRVELFSVVTVPRDSELYRRGFDNKSERQTYLEEVDALSEVKSDVKVTPEDRIVMLSTCTYEYENARLVIYGKLVEVE